MANKAGINYGADLGLIKGEAAMRSAGQVDEAAAFGKGFESVFSATQRGIEQRNAEIAKTDAKVADYVRGMKGNIDVTGLTAQDQKAVNSFLLEQKDAYARAASEAAKLKPGTSEYTRQVDIMNNINNSFVRLKENLNGYELSKTQYADTKNDMSTGNNVNNLKTAGAVFTSQAPFRVDGNGDLIFTTDTGDAKFQDIKMPFKKAYEQSLELSSMYDAVYASGGFDPAQQKAFENKLRAMAGSNPEAFKSIAADSLNSYGNYSNITAEEYDDPNLTKDFIEKFIQGSIQGARDAAAAGKRAKNKNNPGSPNGQDAKYPTPSGVKEGFENGKPVSYGWGYDANGNTVKYYTTDGGRNWSTSIPGTTTTPPPTTPPVNNEFADREEEIKQALEDGIDPKQVFTDATDEEINTIKEKYNIK
jgi:hypothetical protein